MKYNSNMHLALDVINEQLGEGCNENNTIHIKDFKGALAFTYAMKTPAIQLMGVNRVPMTADFGGATPVLNIRQDQIIGPQTIIELMPGMSLDLPELAGMDLRLTYNPIENCAITLLHGVSDKLKGAGQ